MRKEEMFVPRHYFPWSEKGAPLLVPLADHDSHDEAHAHGLHHLACEAAAKHHAAPLTAALAAEMVGTLWMGQRHTVGAIVYEPGIQRLTKDGQHAEVQIRAHMPLPATWTAPGGKKPPAVR